MRDILRFVKQTPEYRQVWRRLQHPRPDDVWRDTETGIVFAMFDVARRHDQPEPAIVHSAVFTVQMQPPILLGADIIELAPSNLRPTVTRVTVVRSSHE